MGDHRSLDFPYRRLGRISQFELDRGLTKNANDRGIFAAFLHTVIMRRVRNAPYETACWNRHGRLRLKILARIHPPGAGDDKAQSVGHVGVRRLDAI